MVLRAWSQRLATVGLVTLVLAIGAGIGVGVTAPNSPTIVFGSDAGVVLTFITPDKVDDFEQVLDRFRTVLAESDDPIRRQQSGNWRLFRSPDPGPNGSVLFVSFVEPVLKGANYSIAGIMAEELPEDEAEELAALLEGALSQSQSTMELESVINFSDELPPELTEETEEDEATEQDGAAP